MRSIYLDYCTTTPIAASVRESMLPFLGELYGHPANSHWFGRAAQEAIEDARSNLAMLLGCHPAEIVFTAGGTESVNIGLLGVARAVAHSRSSFRPHLIISKLEHRCVSECAKQLQREGWEVSQIGCGRDGIIDLDELQEAAKDTTRIVSVIHANHRIGTVQPIERIAEVCKAKDILLHCDSAQAIGKVDCNVDRLGVDLLSLSGHKFYAPKGVGALYLRQGVPIEPILFGEGAEAGLRPGTANVAGIAGLGQAAKLALAGLKSTIDQTAKMRDRFHRQLEKLLGRPIEVHGKGAPRLPNLLSVQLPGVTAEAIQNRVPEICFGNQTPSPVCVPPPQSAEEYQAAAASERTRNPTHAAIGLTPEQSASTLRVSFGWTTSEEEVQQAVQMIASAYESLMDS